MTSNKKLMEIEGEIKKIIPLIEGLEDGLIEELLGLVFYTKEDIINNLNKVLSKIKELKE